MAVWGGATLLQVARPRRKGAGLEPRSAPRAPGRALRGELRFRRLPHAGPGDVVGHVHALVRARVGPPAAGEAVAVLAERTRERRVEWAVGDRDPHVAALHLPPVGQWSR